MKGLDKQAKAEALQAAMKYRNKMIKSVARDIVNNCDGLKRQINDLAASVQSSDELVANEASRTLRLAIRCFQEIERDFSHIEDVEVRLRGLNQ